MPIYDLFCPTCSYEKELVSPKVIDHKDLTEKCEECGILLKKKVSSACIVFKGSGYYETEHGKQKHNHFTPEQGKEEIKDREAFIEKAKAEMP